MSRTVQRLDGILPEKPKVTRVAVYARVSSGKDAMLHSLSAQAEYYAKLVQSHGGWQMAGVYADEALSGTKADRADFQRLLTDCRAGKVDLVITKSISRFARNTVVLLETVRELKGLGVDVYFEEQNIHTISGEGELMLTLLASFAQAEAESVSANQKWRVRKKFEEGMPWNCTMLGYRNRNGRLEPVPDEAAVVQRIFGEYLDGRGMNAIIKGLMEDGIPTRFNRTWTRGTISRILKNYAYTGNLLLQTTFCENCLTKKSVPNEGQMPMYHAESTHEPIISIETFNAVQAEMERRAEHLSRTPKKTYPFTGLITCGHCGKHYRRKNTHAGAVWVCTTFNDLGKAYCPSKQIPESILTELTAGTDLSTVTGITAYDGNRLTFYFTDGSTEERQWTDRSRSESWTAEMKEAARQKALERRRNNG